MQEYVDAVAARLATSSRPGSVFVASDSKDAIREFKDLAPTSWTVHSLDNSSSDELRNGIYPVGAGYSQSEWNNGKWSDQERTRYTTGMLVDFALLSGLWPAKDLYNSSDIQPSAVVCTITYVPSCCGAVLTIHVYPIGPQFARWRLLVSGLIVHLITTRGWIGWRLMLKGGSNLCGRGFRLHLCDKYKIYDCQRRERIGWKHAAA